MSEAEKARPAGGGSSLVKRVLPLVILAGVAALVISQGWHEFLTLESIAQNRDLLKGTIEDNALISLLAYMGIYIVVIALSLPGGVFLTLTGGFLFGWLIGGMATIVAATIGATIIFLIAKTSLGEPLAARAGPKLDKLRAGFQDSALNYLLFLRLVPLFPFFVVNLVPAFLGVSLRDYVIATFIGIIPATFIIASVGNGLGEILAAGDTPDASVIFEPHVLIPILGLAFLALIPVFYKAWKAHKAHKDRNQDKD